MCSSPKQARLCTVDKWSGMSEPLAILRTVTQVVSAMSCASGATDDLERARSSGSKSLRVPWVRGVCAEVFENNTAVFCFFLRQRAAISTRNSNTCSTLSRNEAPVPSSLSTKEAIQTAACMSELVGALISRIDPSHPREGSVLDHGSLRCTRQVSCTVPPDSSPICLLPGLVEVVSGRGSASGGFSGYLRLVTMLCN